MDISIYFDKIDEDKIIDKERSHPNQLVNCIYKNTASNGFPVTEDFDIAIIGVKEGRASVNNSGTAHAPDVVRKYFYELYSPGGKIKITDLGNINPGNSIKDTYFALRNVVGELLQQNVVPVIIGGGQDLTYANYLGYESIGKIINLVAVDNSFDLGFPNGPLTSRSYLNNIITHQPSFLFNFTNIGFQTYFVDCEAIDLMKKLYFDAYRVGVIQPDVEDVEPMVRNADMISIDISSVRMSDAPGNGNSTPNGFYGEELCRIMRYAGLSDKLTSVGIYEINPEFDKNGQTSHLAAQALWYFIDGFYNRKMDFPIKDKKYYFKYRVVIKELQNEIVFYKSKKSDRWWMEVPCPSKFRSKFERHYLVPCSYNDYETAMKEEIPDRWWQAYQKLM